MTDLQGLSFRLERAPETLAVFSIIFVVMLFLRHIKESQKNFQVQIERIGDNFSELVRTTQTQMNDVTRRCHEHESVFLREVERIAREVPR